jgi:hypothetical protein
LWQDPSLIIPAKNELMSTAPFSVHVRTRFDGRVFVPEEPVNLPLGSTLEGDAKRPQNTEEKIGLLQSLAGAWADFDFEEPLDHP